MIQTLTAIIIDDTSSSRNALRAKLSANCPEVTVVAECADAEEGMKMIKEYKPDIVFLDIEMPWLNGFTMLQQMDYRDFEVIFVTAYNHYAIQAIKFSALDYLVKPVDEEELKAAVAKAHQKNKNAKGNQRLDLLLQNFTTEHEKNQRIAIPSLDGVDFIRIDNIIYLEADSNYTFVYLAGSNKMTVSKTLKEFEDMLPATMFIRIHHSYIINCNAVQRYIKGEGGQVIMKNAAVLDVSKRKKSEFLRAMQL